MQWDDLRVFLAVAQAGSLRRAARALGVGQPTVIRHVRELEHSLGSRLFERTPDGHRLTRAGESLLPMAQGMADAATAIDRRRIAFADHAGGVVRVAAEEWVARFLAPRLTCLAELDPDLTVELVETHNEPDLDRRQADLFVRHGLPARGHLVRVGLGTVAAAIYGNQALVQRTPAARSEARWRRCPWVAYDAPHEYFRSMAWLMRHLGDHRPRVRANRFAARPPVDGVDPVGLQGWPARAPGAADALTRGYSRAQPLKNGGPFPCRTRPTRSSSWSESPTNRSSRPSGTRSAARRRA